MGGTRLGLSSPPLCSTAPQEGNRQLSGRCPCSPAGRVEQIQAGDRHRTRYSLTMGLIRTWLARQTRGTRRAVVTAAIAVLAFSRYRVYRAVVAASHYRAAQT